jgi:hypothetical protein
MEVFNFVVVMASKENIAEFFQLLNKGNCEEIVRYLDSYPTIIDHQDEVVESVSLHASKLIINFLLSIGTRMEQQHLFAQRRVEIGVHFRFFSTEAPILT